MGRALVGCLAQLAVTAGSDALWKTLNHQVSQQRAGRRNVPFVCIPGRGARTIPVGVFPMPLVRACISPCACALPPGWAGQGGKRSGDRRHHLWGCHAQLRAGLRWVSKQSSAALHHTPSLPRQSSAEPQTACTAAQPRAIQWAFPLSSVSQVLMASRSLDARTRLLSLETAAALAGRLREEYLVLLPETLPFLVGGTGGVGLGCMPAER
jgi:hypothetical protein